MTTTVDLVALAAAGQTKVTLLGGTITSLGSTGTDYAGFDDADSVYVEVQVQLRDNSRGAASLTLILQGSDDGNSWSTLETFTFSNNGTQTASVDTPNAHLRVTWTVAHNTEWFIDHVTVAPALLNAPGGGGGGSQPNAVTLLGPHAVNFNTANFVNGTGVGAATLAIPAGSFVQAFAIVTTPFVGFAPSDELGLVLAKVQAGTDGAPILAAYDGNGLDTTGLTVAQPEAYSDYGTVLSPKKAAAAVDACHVYAYYIAGGTLTAGSIDVYAFVATPS